MKIQLTILLLLFGLSTNCQDFRADDSLSTQILNQRFIGGEQSFLRHLAENIKYPMDARENCRIGILMTNTIISAKGSIDSINFENEIPLGMGIEDEVIRCIASTKGQWMTAQKSSKLTLTFSFTLDEIKLPQTNLAIVGYGTLASGCPSDKQLIKSFESAKKKKKYKKAIQLCEDIIRRMPMANEYKQELASLKLQAEE
jgi:hypothetical protein